MVERRTPTKGASHPFRIPPKPAASAPECFARTEILSTAEGRVRPELAIAQFAAYLVGEGKGSDGSLPEMFSADEDVPRAFRDSWLCRDRGQDATQPGFDGQRWPLQQAWCADICRRELYEEPRSFRLIISPEERVGRQMGAGAMRDFTRQVVERMESDCFRQFHWVASAHYNTDNPHVHIGIRGLDTQAKPVVLRAEYIRKGVGYRAREVLHEMFPKEKQARRAG